MSIFISDDDNDSKLGISTFFLKGGDCDFGENVHLGICLTSSDDSRNLLFSEKFKLNDVLSHGINVHTHLLKAGKYYLTVVIEDEMTITKSFLVNSSSLLREKVAQSLVDYNTPLIFCEPCDSSMYPYGNESVMPWFDRPDAEEFLEKIYQQGLINSNEKDSLVGFLKDGYMIIENAFEDSFLQKINHELDEVIRTKYQGYEYGSSKRIEHLHLKYKNVEKMWLNQNCRRYIDMIFQSQSRPCQTLTFIFGSQQDAHQDTVHLTPFPAGYMCGLWIALQDIEEGSGELLVYPGSHREKRIRMVDHECEKVNDNWDEFGQRIVPIWTKMVSKYKEFRYLPKKGTALIWHENLLHAGSARLNPDLERRSLVIHYFADGAVGYYDSTGLPARSAPIKMLGN